MAMNVIATALGRKDEREKGEMGETGRRLPPPPPPPFFFCQRVWVQSNSPASELFVRGPGGKKGSPWNGRDAEYYHDEFALGSKRGGMGEYWEGKKGSG